MNHFSAIGAAGLVMDVHTGEILAYVSLPTYDNNLFSGPVSENALQQLLVELFRLV